MPGSEPLVGALIVNWNRRDDLLECIKSLMGSSYPRLDIYVVDNASTDGSAEAVEIRFPDARIIRSEVNLGFAGGNNLGLERILADDVDAVFLVNNDIVVAEDTVSSLVLAGWSHPDIGVLAPKVLVHSQPDVIWSAGGDIEPETGVAVQRHYAEKDHGQADEPAEITYAVGCAMFVKADVIRRVGMMDPRFFMYYEEADWCRRIRHAGYRILYEPQSRVWHKVQIEDAARNDTPYYMSRNRLLYLREAGTPAGRVAWVAMSEILRNAAAHASRGQTHESRLMVRAVVDYYMNNLGALGGA